MRPARLAKSVVLLLAIPAAIGAACTFPLIQFGEPDAGATASSSSSGGGDPTTASSTGSAGGNPTEASSSSSSSSGGALPCDGGACDCDGDQEKAWNCDGSDCADYDPRANTKTDFLLDNTPIVGPKRLGTPEFDFNCNMQGESEFGVVGCNSVFGVGCTGKGFAEETKCGQEGTLIDCGAVPGNLCTQLPNPPKKFQRCR